MKTEHNKGLHSPMHKGIPSANGKPSIDENNQDNGPGLESGDDPEDMSHITSQIDDMSEAEQKHAHAHLSKKLAPNKLEKPIGEDVNDFANAMGEES